MKKCVSCDIEKNIDCFDKDKTRYDGYSYKCKLCRKLERERDKLKIKQKRHEHYLNNRDEIINKVKIYSSNNKEKIKKKSKNYYKNNKEKFKQYRIEHYKNNKESIREKKRNYQNNKLATDSLYKLKHNVKTLIRNSIKGRGYNKEAKTFAILGCSFEYFKKYLESKFEYWMSWDNHGLYNGNFDYGWDIDHIIPLSSAQSEKDVVKLNHYTNFQPLCSHINRNIKRNKAPR